MGRPKDTTQYTHKTCRDCGETKPLADLCLGSKNTMGRRALCRPCNAKRLMKKYYENPEHYRAKTRQNSKGHQRRWNLRRFFGMSLEDYDAMLAKQGGGCAICGSKTANESGKGNSKYLHVDHCHASGKVRGLLCANCNNGIGRFKDEPARMRAAADYVEAHVTPPDQPKALE